jgi:alpha-tubulin suppressor-like RCC1 family protein
MKTKWLIGLIFFSAPLLLAIPIKLTVQPKGTNQVELTLGPVMPDVFYEVLARTNGPEGHWMTFTGYIGGSNKTISAICDLGGIPGLTLKTLNNWEFVAGRWDDPLGDELPPLYKELVLRTDPYSSGDPYGNPMGDGWNNLQKLQNNMDPLRAYPPPPPQANVNFFQGTNDIRHGNAILTWRVLNGPVPDYFLIERANRTLRPITNNPYFQRPPPGARFGAFGTNRPPFDPRFGAFGTNRLSPGERFGVFGTNRPPPNAQFGAYGTNLPPNFRPTYGRPLGSPREDPLVTEPFEVVARVPGRAGLSEYRYVDPNVDTLFQPAYRIQPHYSPPLHARLHQVDAAEIRKTIISVVAQPTTNGYALTVPHPIPYAWYLLLVRDKNDQQWRASGYFASGTNRDSVYLHVDKKGMMHEGQSPIAMPEVKFRPDVVEPEFTAGWGEDSDGDGLPDIYEVLVTHTEPDNADTGNTGILDGFKEMTSDGWNNLEKFRRRVDPMQPTRPPDPVELKQPTGLEIMEAMTPKTDLGCELQIDIRPNGATNYQPIEQVPWMLSKILNFRQPNDHRDFDMRISWRFVELQPRQDGGRSSWGAPAFYKAIEPLMERINFQLAEAFKANLATNPPLSRNDTSNMMAAIEHAYRQGELDKGVAMAEMMTLADNQSQDFYGKIIDQYGQPVAGADVALNINLDFGRGGSQKTQTDADGLFQFTGIRGRSLNIVPEKKGFQIEGHGLGLKGVNGPETSLSNREVYTMWKLKGPEPMIHDRKFYQVKSDDRIYTIDLLSKTIVEGTNGMGDLYVQFQRPAQIKPRENFEWSFTMTAISGGMIEVTNDDYLNEAPASGYQPQYKLNLTPANPKWRGWNGEATFYLKSRGGKVYGHFHLRIDPVYRDGSSLEIESYVNPSGSRNLEFDPSKQTEYIPKAVAVAPLPPPVTPKTSRIASTNVSGQIVGWGSIVLPLVNPGTRFIAVAAGGEHSLALKADGTVVAWGRNLSSEATVPTGLSNVIAIAAGGRSGSGFSLALRRDGRVVAWGDNAHLQTSVPNGLSNVVSIAAGTEHCLALKKDGTIIGWGINEEGRTQSPVGLSNVVAVSAGEEHSVALKNDGTIVAWGRNQHGQASVPEGLSNVVSICSGSYFNLALKKDGSVIGWGGTFNNESDVPKDLTNVTAIAAGPWHGLALKRDGTVVAWGRSLLGETQVPPGLSNVVAISGGGEDNAGHSLALRSDGTLVCWGLNNCCQAISLVELTNIVSVAAGLLHYIAIRSDGTAIGLSTGEHQGDGQAWVPAGLGPVSHVAGGWYHSLAVRSDGTVAGWGFGAFGQTAPPGNLTGVTAVAAGYSHSLALKEDGTVIGWGNSSSVPASLSNVVAIAAATSHSLALKHDGTVIAWGQNGSFLKNVPDDLTDVVAIAAGGEYAGDHDLALKRDGTVTAWGSNSAGQTNVPAGLTNVIAIAAGANHSLALRKDGTVVAWGANNAGQTTIPSGLSNVVAIAAGGLSSIAVVVQRPASYTQHVLQLRHELIALIVVFVFCLTGIFWFFAQRVGSQTKPHNSEQ